MNRTDKLSAIYPSYDRNSNYYDSRISRVGKAFAEEFGRTPRYFSAPGRTEMGGNHTDHQHGHVLAAAVDLDSLCAAAPNGTDTINIISEGFGRTEIELSQAEPVPEEKNTTKAIVRGVASTLLKKGSGGFDMYCTSDVLAGSGLSSSASFEVLLGTVINGLFCGGAVSDVDIAKTGRFAENVYFGKPSGLMDQMACAVGGVVGIDFYSENSPVIDKADGGEVLCGYDICIIDSGASHAGLTDEYAAIPVEMGRVAAYFGKKYLSEVDEEEFFGDFKAMRKKCGDRAALRAYHFFREDKRAVEELCALKSGDTDEFLRLVNESGRSSYMYLQNIYPSGNETHQDMAIALIAAEKLLDGKGAFRVHGGGFAGTVQAFVPRDMTAAFVAGADKYMAEGCCKAISIRAAGGTEITV